MKQSHKFLIVLIAIVITSCSTKPSLQEYFVDNMEKPNFLIFDVPTSILNLKEASLTAAEKEAVGALRKFNILAFKKSSTNETIYTTEKEKISSILSASDYTELMKMNTPYGKATVKYLGKDDAIEEVIIYGYEDSKGFAVIRVLGKEMNPAHLKPLLKAIKKSDYKGEGFEKLAALFK